MTNDRLRQEAGGVTFRSSEPLLNDGFEWAKRQALEYAHWGEDPVGLWYEAALPNRQAFCMRDVGHHSIGAAVLGLAPHTKNMLIRFAENIAESRDWCTYWEITKDNVPAPVDYENDRDFWYNLPANFDMMDVSFRQYLWTGDRDYLNNEALMSFCRLTVDSYLQAWDKDGDGIPEHYPEYGRRGLASFNEVGLQPLIGGDMVAAQIAGYRAYARLLSENGESEAAAGQEARASELERLYHQSWWNDKQGRFYGAVLQDRTYLEAYNAEGNFLPLYYGVVRDRDKLRLALEDVKTNRVQNVEGKTYLPDIYYRYGYTREGFAELLELVDPALERRDYPEVSYCVVGSIAAGLMGLSADGRSTVSTLSGLGDALNWAELAHVPILGRKVAVIHEGAAAAAFTHEQGAPLLWKAAFPGKFDVLLHNGQPVKAQWESTETGEAISSITVGVAEGESHRVEVP